MVQSTYSVTQEPRLTLFTVLAFDLEAFGDGAILGCDFAGTVEALGPNSTAFSVGDKVASFIWGGKLPARRPEYCDHYSWTQ